MKVAIFIKNNQMETLKVEAIYMLILNLENDIIVGMETNYMYSSNIDHVSLYLISKQVNVLYIECADDTVKDFFRKFGITVKTYEDLKENHIFRAFLM